MQEELTQRAALIGGASVSVQGHGPGFASGGSVGFAANLPDQDSGLLLRGGGAAGVGSQGSSGAHPPGASRWISTRPASGSDGERSRDVTLIPDRAALAATGSTSQRLRRQRWPGKWRAPRGGSGSPWATRSCGSRSRPRVPGPGLSTSCARPWCQRAGRSGASRRPGALSRSARRYPASAARISSMSGS